MSSVGIHLEVSEFTEDVQCLLMSSSANQNLRGGRMGAPTFETLILSFNSVLCDNA